uniref:Uncharacterized protein n=1 Tax=Tetraselmis sp. GSL018 TaxID=582737 RepID=A0A061RLE5_9CHLO|eukprot:CAMPEP_0177580872 /NCGR_PEP_ID=MMETSP0419_2-20121207/1822_1 /TAXON_ID=582737 /ORGANISM="Tetraselmis sp., Strain GSL018" /LENGTH=170 /DNA_ID=CAMNT_0019069829 /DNA_START=323 /DNA_END=835 /DNA_ORIENTATION=+
MTTQLFKVGNGKSAFSRIGSSSEEIEGNEEMIAKYQNPEPSTPVNMQKNPTEPLGSCSSQEQKSLKRSDEKNALGRAYVPWTAEEEEALRLGVLRHGVGAWQVILKDPEFAILKTRTGIQLKDKWRNLVKFNHLSHEETVLAAKNSERRFRRNFRRRRFQAAIAWPVARA